jgi:ribosomal-protein-alanine N-acetyltransferase
MIKVKMIEAFMHRDNQRSIKLLERILFTNSNEPGISNDNLISYHLANSIGNVK